MQPSLSHLYHAHHNGAQATSCYLWNIMLNERTALHQIIKMFRKHTVLCPQGHLRRKRSNCSLLQYIATSFLRASSQSSVHKGVWLHLDASSKARTERTLAKRWLQCILDPLLSVEGTYGRRGVSPFTLLKTVVTSFTMSGY